MKRFVSENDQSAAGAEVGNPESETSKQKRPPRNSSSSSTTCPTMSSLPQLAALWFLQQWPPRSRIGIPSTMRRMPSRSPPSSQRPGRPRTRSPGRRQTATTAALRSLGGTLCSIARSELPRGVILVERLGKISFLAFWCHVTPPPLPLPPATLRPRRAKKKAIKEFQQLLDEMFHRCRESEFRTQCGRCAAEVGPDVRDPEDRGPNSV